MIPTPDPHDPEERRVFEADLLPGTILLEIARRMQVDGVSQGEIARRLGWTQPRVSQLLAAGNLTLGTAASLAWALGCRFEVELVDADPIGTPVATATVIG